jgi:WD40 repeat protein
MWDCDLNPLTPRGLHNGGVSALAEFDGTVITGGRDGSVQPWRLKDLRDLGMPRQEHTKAVSAIACATIRKRHVVVSGSEDGSVRSYLLEGLIQVSDAE